MKIICQKLNLISLCLLVLGIAFCHIVTAEDEKEKTADPNTPNDYFEDKVEQDGVIVKSRIHPKKPNLSELVTLSLTVEHPQETHIRFSDAEEALGDFEIASQKEDGIKVENERMIRKYVYQLEPKFAGELELFIPEVMYSKDGSFVEPGYLELDMVLLKVGAQFVKPDGEVPDLAAIGDTVGPSQLSGEPWPLWLKVILVALAVFVVFEIILTFRKRKEQQAVAWVDPRTPEEIANDELKELRGKNLPAQGEFVQFYVELTGVVRRYIERVTDIDAAEQTTEEFLRAMKGDERFDVEKSTKLQQFLESSDLVKYAAQTPDEDEVEQVIVHAEEFVSHKGGAGLLKSTAVRETVEVGETVSP